MAAKTGQFQGLDGHTYQVVLSGMGVTAEPLIFAGESPVVISMAAGERKFVGFKSQTAKVKIVTDHPMLELYGNSATSVTLVIADTTSQSILFSGYVVPFAYSQPYSGCNDVIEIEAVDSITARKEIAYTNFGTPHGTDRSGLAIVQELCRRAGISRIVEHINFSTVAFTGESPLNVPVAQAGFLQDEVSEVDVMAAICKFFGLTAHVFGDTLYLYDEHYLTHSESARTTDVNIYLYNGTWNKSQTYHERDNSPLASQGIHVGDGILSGVTINVERAYDGVQITPEGSDTSVLLPDVCAEENLEDVANDDPIGSHTRVIQNHPSGTWDLPIRWQYRTPKVSKIMEMGRWTSKGLVPFVSTDDDDAVLSEEWNSGTMPIEVSIYTEEETPSTSDSSSATYITGGSVDNYIYLRSFIGDTTIAKQKESYSHTGGFVKVDLSMITLGGVYEGNEWLYPDGDRVVDDVQAFEALNVRCGDLYFSDDQSWSASRRSPALVKSGKLLPTNRAVNFLVSEYIIGVPSSDAICVELGNTAYLPACEYYIKKLEMLGVGDKINESHEDMLHDYISEAVDRLEAKTMLTSRKSGATSLLVDNHRPYGVNARPSVVPATNWVGGYMARSSEETIPISGILMEQLRERYGEPHTAYTMTVGKMLYPYKPTAYEGKKYTIESYDLDLYNTETTVTIN